MPPVIMTKVMPTAIIAKKLVSLAIWISVRIEKFIDRFKSRHLLSIRSGLKDAFLLALSALLELWT